MSPSFYSIPTFRNSLVLLCRKEKNGYHSCKKDICDLLKGLSFDDIWVMNFRIRDMDSIRVIKIRVKNSFLNLSSADGFRLIVCCNKKNNAVALLNIYPKRGKLGIANQSKDEFMRQLKMYITDKKNNSLVKHNIFKELEEIKEEGKK